jgi:hypothetical protein
MRRAMRSVLTAAALGAGGCGGEAAQDPGAGPAGAPAAASCPDAGRSAVEGGVLRMPARAPAGRTPLVVVVVPGASATRSTCSGWRAPPPARAWRSCTPWPATAGSGR